MPRSDTSGTDVAKVAVIVIYTVEQYVWSGSIDAHVGIFEPTD